MPIVHARLPWLVFALALLTTVVGWSVLRQDQQRRTDADFRLRTERATAAIRGRLLAYEQILRGAVALFDITGSVSRAQWRTFVERLRIDESLPGIQGIGFGKPILASEKSAHCLS